MGWWLRSRRKAGELAELRDEAERGRLERERLADDLAAEKDRRRATDLILAARGILPSGPVAGAPPPALVTAARTRSRDGQVLHLAAGGVEAVALIGPEGGDPAEIWAGIRAKLAELDGGAESA